ncbi:MAG: TrkH family potassium uptake protein, partial [Blautia sp.]|nr:TrkH family potassium uptake protein [Blautia sp.]
MNYSIIIYILGWILEFTGVLMVIPGITAVIYRERSGFAFLITILVSVAIGLFITRKKPKNTVFHIKEAFVTTSLSWILLSIAGAVPFVISRSIPHPIDALFETVSGFTTTGASILPEVEPLSHCMLIWRSFTHWIGGMGVLVFLLCLLPLTGGYNMTLMK